MTKLFLHAGMHKTGSTSLQHALHANREELIADGFFYPPQGERRNHHHFSREIAQGDLRAAADYVKSIERSASSGCAVILSSECFHRDAEGSHGWKAYSEPRLRERRDKYLELLAFAVRNFDVEVVIYFRRADEYAESVYKTMVLGGHLNEPFNQFLIKWSSIFDYERTISEFSRHFSRVTIRPYETNMVGAFCGVIGANLETKVLNKNISADARLIYWMTRRHGNWPIAARRRRNQRAFVEGLEPAEIFGDSKSSFWRSKQEREGFAAKYHAAFPASFFPEAKHPVSGSAELRPEELTKVDSLWKAEQLLGRRGG